MAYVSNSLRRPYERKKGRLRKFLPQNAVISAIPSEKKVKRDCNRNIFLQGGCTQGFKKMIVEDLN